MQGASLNSQTAVAAASQVIGPKVFSYLAVALAAGSRLTNSAILESQFLNYSARRSDIKYRSSDNKS